MGFRNQAFSEQVFRYNTGVVQLQHFFFLIGAGNTDYGAGAKQRIFPEPDELARVLKFSYYKTSRSRACDQLEKFNRCVNCFSFALLFEQTVPSPRQDGLGKDHMDWECFLTDPLTPRAISWTHL